MVITDLDGTLLNPDQGVSQQDYETLEELGRDGDIRVIATGRSPFSFQKVIPRDFPIDYLVFSSGSGIMDWKTGEILETHTLDAATVEGLVHLFLRENVSFKVLLPAPLNHHFIYFRNNKHHPDFEQRMEYYRGFEQAIQLDPPNFHEASQLLIILDHQVSEFNRLSALCHGVKVIRATSPIDHTSIWMEVFHPGVSKGHACASLCRRLNIPAEHTLAVGNDYNDLDLLDFAGQSFVVENAPEDLISRYSVVRSNRNSGFSDAVSRMTV